MKNLGVVLFACLMLVAGGMFIWTGSAFSYTINDDTSIEVGAGKTQENDGNARFWRDVIGENFFDTVGIDVTTSSSEIAITMYTKFCGKYPIYSDTVYLADLGLDLDLDGTYEYGIVLTTLDGPTNYEAKLYENGTWTSSYNFWDTTAPSPPGQGNANSNWTYGEFYPGPSTSQRNAWVKMEGGTEIGDVGISRSGSVALWEWVLTINQDTFGGDASAWSAWRDDFDNGYGIYWATSTCANDVIEGVVPIPTTILLLGSGLLGVVGLRKKFKG